MNIFVGLNCERAPSSAAAQSHGKAWCQLCQPSPMANTETQPFSVVRCDALYGLDPHACTTEFTAHVAFNAQTYRRAPAIMKPFQAVSSQRRTVNAGTPKHHMRFQNGSALFWNITTGSARRSLTLMVLPAAITAFFFFTRSQPT